MSTISNLIFNGAKHYITSAYGPRKSLSTSKGQTGTFHRGTDYGTNSKKIPQYAIEDGYCFNATVASDGAKYVWIIYPRVKLAMLHYHLDTVTVKKGQAVKKGTKIGTTGMTGKATGIHLHLGIKDLKSCSDDEVENMTQARLNGISFVDPEKVSYSSYASFTGYVTASSLNVRKGAGTKFLSIGKLVKGSAVTVIGEVGTWYKIKYKNTTAYVSRTYISKKKPTTISYFKAYTGKSVSLVDALKAQKVDSSFTNRKKIAAANGVKNYIGTPKQNTQLLNLLKAGKCIKP